MKSAFLSGVLVAGVLMFSAVPVLAECVTGGCSGELCVSKGADVASICIWHDSFACYKSHGECAEQADGKCGWIQTKALQDCLQATKQPLEQ